MKIYVLYHSQFRFLTQAGSIALAVLTTTVARAAESEFEVAHTAAVAVNPAGTTFSIAIVGGQTRFHVGELIPLEIVYQFE